jgi:uncharacterized protein (DUF1697 family)
MTAVVSLLRGINVGGRHMVAMEALRELYTSLGLKSPRTYVQSGNVVFATERKDLAALARQIETRIERDFGFRPSVIQRSAAELESVVARNPFAKRKGIEPGKLLVLFLAADPDVEARRKVPAIKADPEELRLDGREVYIYYPLGAGRSKLPFGSIEKALKVPATGRNWNTVTKLLEMAKAL